MEFDNHINQYWERRRIAESSLYMFQNYLNYGIYGGTVNRFEPNSIQITMLHHFQNTHTHNTDSTRILAHRQSGTTTAMVAYAVWETFFVKTHQVNVFVCYNESMARDIRSKILDLLDCAKSELAKVGINTAEIRQDGHGGFKCTKDLNTLRVISIGSIQSATRGLNISSAYFDNIMAASNYHAGVISSTKDFLRKLGTKIYELQTGLYIGIVSEIEENTSSIRLPIYVDINFSIERENDLINRIGANRFSTDYLLMRN